jgi:peptidyl-prolyl cis-trans isomerase D
MEQGILDQVFADLSRQTLLTSYADTQGISATTGSVVESIRTDPVFQDTTGVFDASRYAQLLDVNGFREADYESNIEADLTIDRLQRVPLQGLRVPNALARLQAAYAGELRSASWFVLQQTELPEVQQPTEEDLQELYETRKELLREPERRGVSLIRLSPDDFIAQSDVTEEDISAYYEAYKGDRYTGPDSRSFTEFTFADEATARAALGRIAGGAAATAIETALATELKNGRRDAIANDRLADQVFARGALVGSIHGPQPVDGQFVVIRLEAITPGAATPLENVREEIRDELARELAVGLFYDALPQFDDLLGTGADLESIAEGLGAPVLSFAPVDTNGFTKDGRRYLPLVTAPGLLQMVYAQSEGRNTERFGDDEVTWIARVDSIVPERLPEFEEVRDDLTEAWTMQRQSEQLQTIAAEIEGAIADGSSSLEAEAAKYNAEVTALPRPIGRTSTETQLPRQIIDGIFGVNEEGDTFSLQAGSSQTFILQVTEIDRADDETLDILAQSSALEIQTGISEDLLRAYFMSIADDIELNTNASGYEAYKRSLVTQQ